MNGLTWKIERHDGGQTRVVLSGELTETSDFEPLLSELPDDVLLDLADVRRINSCGVREWVGFAQALRASGKRFVLARCSTVVVSQLNMISNFAANAPVLSVQAPYFCESCGHPHRELVTLDAGRPVTVPESVPCPQCGGKLEFDDVPEQYFSFHDPNLPR